MTDTTSPAPTSRLLRRADAAAYIRSRYGYPCSTQYLAKLACIGGGPRFRKIGRYPIYDTADLDAWIASRTTPPMLSTSTLVEGADNDDMAGNLCRS